ncbi:MAG: hypothetical protein AAFZ65_10970, partial [Planctomycetota bacterium]
MSLPHSKPIPNGQARAEAALRYRERQARAADARPHAATEHNVEENDHQRFPANFSKGLLHRADGLLDDPTDYRAFVEAINAEDDTRFETAVRGAIDRAGGDASALFRCQRIEEPPKCEGDDPPSTQIEWRGWESPRAGHAFDLEGPDAGEVGMAPAPRVGSSELSAEMAEVYCLALLRDVPFTRIAEGEGERLCGEEYDGTAEVTAQQVAQGLSNMPFFSGN